MMQIQISPSTRADKKFQAVVDDQKTIHFGSKGVSDFTLDGDKARKGRYESRHKKREDWADPKTTGFYAKNTFVEQAYDPSVDQRHQSKV